MDRYKAIILLKEMRANITDENQREAIQHAIWDMSELELRVIEKDAGLPKYTRG